MKRKCRARFRSPSRFCAGQFLLIFAAALADQFRKYLHYRLIRQPLSQWQQRGTAYRDNLNGTNVRDIIVGNYPIIPCLFLYRRDLTRTTNLFLTDHLHSQWNSVAFSVPINPFVPQLRASERTLKIMAIKSQWSLGFVTYLTLLSGPLQNSFLNRSLANQPIHGHLLRLTQPMRPVHSLLIHRRIPIRVVEDHLKWGIEQTFTFEWIQSYQSLLFTKSI